MAVRLESNSIKMRFVEEKDAEFILSLRLDPKYNSYISKVNNDVVEQRTWISKYKILENSKTEFYFIIERLDGTPCGTVRVYDLTHDSFCWGSWILNENKTRYSAIESALLVYKFGFSDLGFKKSHFDVMKENQSVINFHKKLGAEIVGEDHNNFYFEITENEIEIKKSQLKRLLK